MYDYDYHLRLVNGYSIRIDTVCGRSKLNVTFYADEEAVTSINYNEGIDMGKAEKVSEYLRMATETNSNAADKDKVLLVTMLAKIREIIDNK